MRGRFSGAHIIATLIDIYLFRVE